MIESPLIEEPETREELKGQRKIVLESLAHRLGPAPDDVAATINVIRDRTVLRDLNGLHWKFAGWDDVRAWLREHATA